MAAASVQEFVDRSRPRRTLRHPNVRPVAGTTRRESSLKSTRLLVMLLSIPIASLAEEPSPRLETEFVASDIFRSGSVAARTWKGIHFDGQYFGTESADVGITGFSWEFRWKQL